MTGWDLLKALRRYAVSTLALTVIGTVAALGYALTRPGVDTAYLAHASTHIVVDTESIPVDTSDPSIAKAYLEVERGVQVPFYASDSVLAQAITTTGVDIELQDLSKNVVIVTPKSPNSLETIIYVKLPEEKDAIAMADAIAEAGIRAINQNHDDDSFYTTAVSQKARADAVDSSFSMTTLEENNGQNVKVGTTPTSSKKKLVAGFALGLLLGIGQAALRWLSDKRVRNFDDLADATDSPIIGATSKNVVTTALQTHPTVKFLRSSVLADKHMEEDVVVITSPRLHVDTSNIAQALAASLQASGHKALLIDASQDSDVNIQSVTRDNWRQQAEDAEYVWGTDANASNTADFLASQQCAELLSTISQAGVVPIVSAAGILDNTAALMPMSKARTVLLVSSGATTATDIHESEKMLASMNKTVDGVILGDVSQSLHWKLRYGRTTARTAA